MKSKELIPAEATHPGYLVREEIEYTGATQKEIASQMGIAANILNELIVGKRNITPALALKLEEVLGIDAEYWLRLQNKYELDLLRIKNKKNYTMLKFISQNAAAL